MSDNSQAPSQGGGRFKRWLISGVGLVSLVWLGVSQIRSTQGAIDVLPTAIPAAQEFDSPVNVQPTGPPALIRSPPPTPTPVPLRFVFPSQLAPPVSAWRPPLYPVPWAPSPNDHFFFIRPIAADQINWPDAEYRYGGIFFENTVHSGVDIQAPMETPVLAAGPGKVIWAGYGIYSGTEAPGDPYGLAVVIRHEFGFNEQTLYTLYAHLSEVQVTRGQHVDTGYPVGLVGVTGFSTGPHLHFEVRLGKNDFFTTYNPELWMAPPQGWGVLVGRVMGTGGQLLFNQEITLRNLATDQVWEVVTYGDQVAVNADPYYRENFVIGDLPAGEYEVSTPYLGRSNRIEFEVFPGQVTYFTYRGREGYRFGAPPPTATPEAAP